jgi:hypothetical protein
VQEVISMEGIGDRWNWKNVVLFATSGVLLWKRHWILAAVPIGAIVLFEGRQKQWW